MQFAYEAMRPDGSTVAEQIEAGDRAEAAERLRERGLIVLRLEKHSAPRGAHGPALPARRAKVTTRDRILFTRQMKMLLEAGTPLVPALEAVAQQTSKPTMRQILGRLRERVEDGGTLCEALESERKTFDPVFRSMIAAGEATATLPQVFDRLCALAQRQHETRKMLLGALLYPLILSIMLVGVVAVLLFFVVPRFRGLFVGLGSPLPATTQLLFEASEQIRHGWPYAVGGLVAVVAVGGVWLRQPSVRRWLDEVLLKLPAVGPLVARLIFARVVRVWAAMLRCHVPLLDTIRQSREATTNVAFLRLLTDVEETVSSGGRMAQALTGAGIADSIIVSAIRTGEENGRLAEATDFVSDWIDDDNTKLVQNVTRLAEPVLLALMGVIVGFVAMSLFLPLFELAAGAG